MNTKIKEPNVKNEPILVPETRNRKLNTVPLDWKEVYYTNCPLVSASNVDQELGWTQRRVSKRSV